MKTSLGAVRQEQGVAVRRREPKRLLQWRCSAAAGYRVLAEPRRRRLAGWTAMAVLTILAGCSTAPERVRPGSEAPVAAPTKSPGAEIERGKASWYGWGFHGRRTASGERFDMNDLTAAHRTLPFGTRVRVRNTQNGLEVVVRINDRGPRISGRIIDLSKAAAAALDFLQAGEAAVVLTEL